MAVPEAYPPAAPYRSPEAILQMRPEEGYGRFDSGPEAGSLSIAPVARPCAPASPPCGASDPDGEETRLSRDG